MSGCSWMEYFGRDRRADSRVQNGKPLGEEYAIYPPDRAVGWELHAQAALRKGDYKIVFLKQSHGGKAVMNDRDDEGGWELFNIAADPGETVDLSKEKPEKLQELLDHWSEYVTDYGVVWEIVAADSIGTTTFNPMYQVL
ncbi:hypothetical protein EHS25_007394 [Saitozyma podzolica]|uniref:Sulfatase N-terminal domain-containing protein n=1 Tax=Saitozyma podzolica TaxID=1890683 RepID=A0A427YPN2_9TREE|nr:hypothetical protein EHS25_007394 [Saitozyma podzolica]